jgi:hypothetical protein
MGTSSVTSSAISGRTLHLVDIENLVGNPRAETGVVLATVDAFLANAHWAPGDHVIVAANPGLMARVAFDLPVPANVHCAPGRDGADRMLLAVVSPHTTRACYGRLVIGSGDGIFAGRARAMADAGLAVEVIARPDGCSRRLQCFACSFLAPAPNDVVLAA